MTLIDLLRDIEPLILDKEIPIWLAARTVEGQRIEEVEIVPVGGISVDEDSQELILLAANYVQSDEIRSITTVDEFCNWATGSPGHFATFLLYGAQRQIDLPDGGIARSYDSLDAWFLPKNPTALWLLFSPLDQWPSEWFVT
ncbi:hypothetical protein C7B65_13145 [Phormidesmis priestleyi ULC007]|uniref:Uncharacterized protein n=1 Tax=Phormidesmis priestleyi ULC007 TaxID=1920490 RepID=A0A2T1DEM5_9CYAN|nr:hypothetical protein [Phormidesmis priestleyi]PSB18960.1 hypothetical protein C7B65_13145 [Phormidesmis priestleyi ULC007]PZO53948.1 MAG: hypothetical protein DCF14_03200 [Phormidesmis priestleyi]